ncbi:MAG: type II toxin-antitoxin system VapC family toxin [Ignavibacteriales bacterium]|nr:type II toxin-antitoxin system VapC family toxin [Ignavibacteriales bacterium]
MKYLLDTNICIYLIKKQPEIVINHFVQKKPGDIMVSSVTVAELYFGVAKSSRHNENMIALKEFLQPLVVIDFNEADAAVYGEVRAQLEKKGRPIGSMDIMIAAHAKSRNLILVTNNEKEFKHLSSLKIENWANK